MHFFTAAAAAVALTAPVVDAARAIVHNQCQFPVFLWSVTADSPPGAPYILAPGQQWSEGYQKPSIGGVSVKIASLNSVTAPITQFEYTLDGKIWYDLSNINCKGANCPFQPYGMFLQSGSGCPTVSCPGGQASCSGAYNNPDDNWASLACDASADTAVYLCASYPTKKDEIPMMVNDTEPPKTTLATAVRVSEATATVTATSSAEAAAEPTVVERATHRRHPHQRP